MKPLVLLTLLLMILLPCINNIKQVTSSHFWCNASNKPLLTISCSQLKSEAPELVTSISYMQNLVFLRKTPTPLFPVTYHLQKAVEWQDQPGASSLSPFGWQCHSRWRQTLSHSQSSPACSLHLCQPCSLALLHHKWKHPTSCTGARNKRGIVQKRQNLYEFKGILR